MDWIKVLVKHLLHEYNDLSAAEYQAWVKIMALTAHLEHLPDQKQMLSVARYQTIESLDKKLHNHSTDLSSILHKVLIDVSEVVHRRQLSKINTQRFRERNKPVINDVIITSSHREEKRREEKNNTPIVPKQGTAYTKEFLTFYQAYPNRKGKDAAWKAWKKRNGDRPSLENLLSAIERQKESEQWQKDGGQFIPHPATWLNQGRWEDETEIDKQSSIDKFLRGGT